uniref:Uncharacterized protein n=1 Tax=Avena sativa TaxID=4498 RepID=A0ACD5Y013_AVESA
MEDDSSLFLQWALSTLQHPHPGVLAEDGGEVPPSLREASQAASAVVPSPTELAGATKSRSSSVDTGEIGCIWSMSPNSGGTSAPISILPMSWNFGAVSAQPSSGGGGTLAAVAATLPEMVHRSQPTRRGGSAGTGPAYAQDHIMAERKRRERINQRFIELSAVIPGLKKMDKGTILSQAVRHVKELQERVRSLEAAAGASTGTSIQTVVLVKKPCVVAPGDDERSPARFSALPEIEVKLSENNVMVRVHCEDGKGLVVRVLAEAEELHLRILHSNVMPFTPSTVIITIMAKVQEGFTIKTEEIVGSLNCALDQHSSRSY